jgi:uncharacterized protein YhaN
MKKISKSETRSSLKEQLVDTVDTLTREGEGKSLDELRKESEGLDPDNMKAELETLSEEISQMTERLQGLSTKKAEAQSELDKIAGSANAAVAAEARQQALAEMRETAEQYVSVKTAAKLLRWAIEDYRKKKQAPLLMRAGILFQILTLDEFQELTVDYDENDQAHLMAVRSNGSHVAVGGLSDGTVDQLYLALRVAAVEEYLRRGIALPFVTDDLFINYDDERSAAGFQVLTELAQETQVLFFTHHNHLVEIAVKTLPPSLPVRINL